MIHFVLIVGLFLLAIAVTMVARALTTPRGPSTETIEQISAYGFAGTLPTSDTDGGLDLRARLGDVTGSIGRWLAHALLAAQGQRLPVRLIAAGMYTTTPERLLGTQFLAAVGLPFVWLLARQASAGAPAWFVALGTLGAVVIGWMLPMIIVDSRARKRRDAIEEDLPDLIDLIVVTLEAGLSFPQSLRLAATKVKEPLASEVRLTLQEQNMGLTLVEALENFLGAHRHARRAHVRPLDRAGRDDGRLDRPDHAEPRDRAQEAAAGLCGGAGAEGAGEDPLPDALPDHAGAVHRLLLPVMIRIMDVL